MRHVGGPETGTKLSKTGPKTGTKLSETGPKTGPKLSKTSHKLSETQSNGRVNPPRQYKPVWDPETIVCSHTPRFSFGQSETVICTCPTGTRDRPSHDM